MEMYFSDLGQDRYQALVNEARNEALAAQIDGHKLGLIARISGLFADLVGGRRAAQ
jgi:hypothetical protein